VEDKKVVCKSCGHDSFTIGQVGGDFNQGNIRPIDSVFSVGSPFIVTFCKDCGEVASIKVEKPQYFK